MNEKITCCTKTICLSLYPFIISKIKISVNVIFSFIPNKFNWHDFNYSRKYLNQFLKIIPKFNILNIFFLQNCQIKQNNKVRLNSLKDLQTFYTHKVTTLVILLILSKLIKTNHLNNKP